MQRCLVVKVLLLKGLIKGIENVSLSSVLVPSEKRFLESYVTRYVDQVPQLLSVYQGKVEVRDTPRCRWQMQRCSLSLVAANLWLSIVKTLRQKQSVREGKERGVGGQIILPLNGIHATAAKRPKVEGMLFSLYNDICYTLKSLLGVWGEN
ncbi:hypothetical protein DVH24_015879 [Malus domestica]|uniref:Uncharacterized protein n=1 Tax=Malus domestica TaxID=3750 RepID=A0A498JJH9_MALDO|nr:hypothetical protein DVH24_015879 [Malus domestica]